MPPVRRVNELLEHYSDQDFRDAFVDCWAAQDLLSDCVLSDDWEVPAQLSAAIELTPAGIDWVTWCVNHGGVWDTAKAVVFTAFARENLFVDVVRTDIAALLASLSTELREGRIRIPNSFGRRSDDVYALLFSEWKDTLTRAETKQFLAQTPQGLAQIGDVIFGPLGVLISIHVRHFDVGRLAAGFYCDDPGCDALHGVGLQTATTRSSDLLALLRDELGREDHRHSEWGPFLRQILFSRRVWEADRFTAALPELVANAFSESEQRLLLGSLLRSGGGIREALSRNDHSSSLATGHADEVAGSLSENELVQCILVESDARIVESIELLVRDEQIEVPSTEVRVSRFSRNYVSSGLLRCSPQVSRLGVRFAPQRREGLSQLRSFVRELYDSEEELDWNLRHVAGESTGERLNTFILNEDPAVVIRTLAFRSPDHLRRALELIGPGLYDYSPAGVEAEDALINSMLWKLGLTLHAHPEYLPRFHDRVSRFADTVEDTDATPPETQRDAIRGAGSNLFVSLEEVLDSALAFTSWALTFDHFGARRRRFEYTLSDAREHGFRFINCFTEGTDAETLDPGGINTLAPLSAGYAHLADALTQADQERILYSRPEAERPQWASESSLELFPFAHTLPWLDLTSGSRERLLPLLVSVPGVLTRSDVARVRNLVSHRRDDFPSGSEIRRVCETVRQLVKSLEDAGVAPNVFTLEGRGGDAFGRSVVTLRDYSGRTVSLATPSEILRSDVPSTGAPQAILRASVIQGTSEPLRFVVREESEYERLWRDWPTVVQAPAEQPTARSNSPQEVATGLSDTPNDGGPRRASGGP